MRKNTALQSAAAAKRDIVNLRRHNLFLWTAFSPVQVTLAESADLTPSVDCHQLIDFTVSIPSRGESELSP